MFTRYHPKVKNRKVSRYTPHQGKQECARRIRQKLANGANA